jgi:hypothetical protein
MPAWLIVTLVSVASMPLAYGRAGVRRWSPRAWLYMALIFGPFALLALLIVGERRLGKEAVN